MGFKYSVDESFFDAWSEEMAYVLGFMYADGDICEYAHIRARYVDFSNSELEILKRIKGLLQADHPIQIRQKGGNYKVFYRLRIGSHRLFKRLVELGVTPRKSLTMEFPDVPQAYFGAFMLGYFDGDGCVYLDKKNKRIKKHRIFLIMHASACARKLCLRRKYAIFKKYLKLRKLTEQDLPLLFESKGPVVNRKHGDLQNRYSAGSTPAWASEMLSSRKSRGDGMVDSGDLKSPGLRAVWVRLPPPAPIRAVCYSVQHDSRPRLS